jgi:hypothetical protein
MRNRGVLGLLGALVVLSMTLAACGGNEGDGDGGERGRSPLPTCTGDPVGDAGLPADFPVPADVTFTATSTAGPSTIVDGFATDTVDHLWTEWKDVLDQAGYTELFSENEAPDDAEISYESADGSSTGQVALRNDCGGGDTIAVHVTDRPASTS